MGTWKISKNLQSFFLEQEEQTDHCRPENWDNNPVRYPKGILQADFTEVLPRYDGGAEKRIKLGEYRCARKHS